jgi:hypothetical protein
MSSTIDSTTNGTAAPSKMAPKNHLRSALFCAERSTNDALGVNELSEPQMRAMSEIRLSAGVASSTRRVLDLSIPLSA